MAPGGMGIVPQPIQAHPDGLLPNRVLALWPYTDMTDNRIHWGSKLILLRQDQNARTPTKIGLSANDGWVAYLRKGHLFLKTFEYIEGANYPDNGCSLEMYTNDRMLELETLGPLQRLATSSSTSSTGSFSMMSRLARMKSLSHGLCCR